MDRLRSIRRTPGEDSARSYAYKRPRLLDLFCGAGGAAEGYRRAGWDVYGIDIKVQPHYPFWFMRGDVTWLVPEDILDFDAIHASPPCQAYSAMNRIVKREYPRLIEPVRELLRGTGLPYVIENVEGAPLENAVTLCGTMFSLPIRRHRLFEVHPAIGGLLPPCTCRNGVAEGRLMGTRLRGPKPENRRIPPVFPETELRAAVGVDWMPLVDARQAIPPAYTEWIGRQLLAAMRWRREGRSSDLKSDALSAGGVV